VCANGRASGRNVYCTTISIMSTEVFARYAVNRGRTGAGWATPPCRPHNLDPEPGHPIFPPIVSAGTAAAPKGSSEPTRPLSWEDATVSARLRQGEKTALFELGNGGHPAAGCQLVGHFVMTMPGGTVGHISGRLCAVLRDHCNTPDLDHCFRQDELCDAHSRPCWIRINEEFSGNPEKGF